MSDAHFIETIIGVGILLFAAKLMAELFLRLKLPIVLGELIAGMIVGTICIRRITNNRWKTTTANQ